MIDAKLVREVDLLHKRICYALGDPTRVLILYALSDGPLCVSEIVEVLGFSQPTISRHLRVLRERGLVNTEREGTNIFYSLADRRVVGSLDLLRAVLQGQMEAEAQVTQTLA